MATNEPTHAQCAQRHAMRRAWQRYGLAVALADLRAAERRIWAGDADWLCDCADMQQAFRVRLKERRVVVIFSIPLGVIVTVLPSAAWVRELRDPARRGGAVRPAASMSAGMPA